MSGPASKSRNTSNQRRGSDAPKAMRQTRVGVHMSEEQILCLFKFGKKIHMEDFRCNGALYMNSVQFFKDLENHGKIGDENEGLVECFQAARVDVIFKDPHDQSTLLSTKDGSLTLRGQIRTRDALIDQQNIFCMYALKYNGQKPGRSGRTFFVKPDTYMPRIFEE